MKLYLLIILFLVNSCGRTHNQKNFRNFNSLDSILLLINPGQLTEAHRIYIKGVSYWICYHGIDSIYFIETSDTNFITSEGLKIGMKYDSLEKYRSDRLYYLPGWAFCQPLKSGWTAAFNFKEKKNELHTMEDSTVIFFFKRSDKGDLKLE